MDINEFGENQTIETLRERILAVRLSRRTPKSYPKKKATSKKIKSKFKKALDINTLSAVQAEALLKQLIPKTGRVI